MNLCQKSKDPSSNFYLKLSTLANKGPMATGPASMKKNILNQLYQLIPLQTTKHSDMKLNNYSLGIVKSTSAINLDRLEDFYVDFTNAELSLNRYKVTS